RAIRREWNSTAPVRYHEPLFQQGPPMKHAISLKSLALVVAASFSLPALAQLDTEAQKRGYSVGANIGVNLAAQGLENELDQAALAAGIRDGLASNLQMSEVEILEVLQGLQDLLQEKALAEQEAFAQQGLDFLAQN